jgi:hypothetical protein
MVCFLRFNALPARELRDAGFLPAPYAACRMATE